MKGSLMRAVNRKKRSPMYSSAKGARSRLTAGNPGKAVDTFGGASARRGYQATKTRSRVQSGLRRLGASRPDNRKVPIGGVLDKTVGQSVSKGTGSFVGGVGHAVSSADRASLTVPEGTQDYTFKPAAAPMQTSGPSGELQGGSGLRTVDRSVRSTEGFSASKAGGLGDVLASAKRRRRGSRY